MSKNAFMAEHLSQAIGRVRGAKQSDVVLQRGEQFAPSSSRYKQATMRESNMDKSAMLYGANTNTPYAKNTIIKNPVLGWEFAIDDVRRLNERVKKRREFRYFIESYIGLSRQRRRRCYKMILFPPLSMSVDPESFMDSRRHLEHMAARSAHTGQFVCKLQGFVGEDDRDECAEHDPGLETASRDDDWRFIEANNISWDGFLRKLKSLADGEHKDVNYHRFQPHGDVMIRLSIDDAFGIVFDREHLSDPGMLDMVQSWLRDIKTMTSGDMRNYYWDANIRAYRRVQSDDHVPPSNAVEQLLDTLENNMTEVNQF